MIGDEDVLRLEVAVIDAQIMTKLNGAQDLQEDRLDQEIVADEMALFGDAGEEVPSRTEFEDNVRAFGGIHDAGQPDHIGMLASQTVEPDLALLAFQLPRIQADLVECLDGI